MYRVHFPSGVTVDCEGAKEVQELLANLNLLEAPPAPAAATESAPQAGPDLQARDEVVDFLRNLTETSAQIVRSLLEDPVEGMNLNQLKTLLHKKDPRAVGGAIAGVGRNAKGRGLPHPITFDKDTRSYRLTNRFLQLYRNAGSPPIPGGSSPS